MTHEIKQRLRNLGLRPTRQRMRLFALLLDAGSRHLNAYDVHKLLRASGDRITLATIYNILDDFVEVT